jgi:hypothetical protein
VFVQMAAALHNASVAAAPAGDPPLLLDSVNHVLTSYTSEQLVDCAESLWTNPRTDLRTLLPSLGVAAHRSHQNRAIVLSPAAEDMVPEASDIGFWNHLAYAYMLESTNLIGVFGQVIRDYAHGGHLSSASSQTGKWLRTTEELFFSNRRQRSNCAPTSNIPPDREALRRSAYFTLLGLDLPLGDRGAHRVPYTKADIANRDFVRLFEQLLNESWRLDLNRSQVGAERADPTPMLEIGRQLREMLTARRISGNLTREEFDAVMTLSWFDLTLIDDTRIVIDLGAQSTSPALRLKKIAERVDVPVHSRADSFFQMAESIAWVLTMIETGALEADNVERLYLGDGRFAHSMQLITSQWSIATGRSQKSDSIRPLGTPAHWNRPSST